MRSDEGSLPQESVDVDEVDAPASERPGRRLALRLVGYAVAAALLVWIGSMVLRNWQAVRSHEWHVRPLLLAASCLCLTAARCLLPAGARRVLRVFGKDVPAAVCWRAYALSQFAKYVPGGVWLFVARAYLYSRYGIARGASGVVVVVEQACSIAGGLLVFVASLPWFPTLRGTAWLWACPAAMLGVLAVLHPRVVSWAYNLVHPRVDGRRTELRVSYGGILGLLVWYAVFWAAAGLSFCLLAAALTELPTRLWVAAAGMFSGACGLGFLVVVVPAGLGVREGGLTGLLSLVYALPVAAALTLAARLWWLATDVAMWAASLGVLAWLEKRQGAAGGAESGAAAADPAAAESRNG